LKRTNGIQKEKAIDKRLPPDGKGFRRTTRCQPRQPRGPLTYRYMLEKHHHKNRRKGVDVCTNQHRLLSNHEPKNGTSVKARTSFLKKKKVSGATRDTIERQWVWGVPSVVHRGAPSDARGVQHSPQWKRARGLHAKGGNCYVQRSGIKGPREHHTNSLRQTYQDASGPENQKDR